MCKVLFEMRSCLRCWKYIRKPNNQVPVVPVGEEEGSMTQESSIETYTCVLSAKSLQLCLTLCNPMDCSLPGSLCPWNSPGQNTGVGCHSLLQGIFPTQGSNPGFPHCRQILYHLSHQGSPLFVIFKKRLFIYLLYFGCAGSFLCSSEWEFSLVAVNGLLTAMLLFLWSTSSWANRLQ